MATVYKFYKFNNPDTEGYVIRTHPSANEIPGIMTFSSRDVFEISQMITAEGPQMIMVRMDTRPAIGSQITFNQSAVIFETIINVDSKLIPYIEDVDRKASEQVSNLVLH